MKRNILKLLCVVCSLQLIQGCSKSSDDTPVTPPPPVVTVPVMTTSPIISITQNTAISGGSVTSGGGAIVTGFGICWSTSQNPTITNFKTVETGNALSFASSMASLIPSTVYYVRAYATNSAGTGYGNQITFTTSIASPIGQSYGGGIIFYVDGTGNHGLIAATADQGTSVVWYNGTFLATLATSEDDGALNTSKIITAQGNGGYAAKLCRSYTGGGYNDWYLPSKNELKKLYLVKTAVGGFADAEYWTSTETTTLSTQNAWVTFFGNDNGSGNQGTNIKWDLLHVRAIRAY